MERERYGTKRALRRLAADGATDPAERPAGYRVEHWDAGMVVVLARLQTAVSHPAELDRFATRLQAEGESTGLVVLVAEASGQVVTQRSLARPARAWHQSPLRKLRPAPLRLSAAPPSPALGNAGRDHHGG